MAITVTNTAGKLETRIKSFFAQPELTVSMALPLIIDHYHFTVNCQFYYWDVSNSGSADDEAHSTRRSPTFCSQLHQTSKLQVLVKSDQELCIESFMQSIFKAEQQLTCLASPDAVV